MDTLSVTLELPRDLLGALDVPQVHLSDRLQELVAIELFREGRISSGKGAELLGISKLAFVQLLAQYGVAYFTELPEELTAEVVALEQLLGEQNA
jgi:predicted HTH domain antitoxin